MVGATASYPLAGFVNPAMRNTAAFEALLTNKLKAVTGVIWTQTVITPTSHKDAPALPLRA